MKRITIILIAGLFSSSALADATIDALSAGTALGGTELLPMFQTSNPAVTTTPSAIATYLTGLNNTWSGTALFTGAITATGSNGQMSVGTSAVLGARVRGKGSTNDVTIENSAGAQVLSILTGTQNVIVGTGSAIAQNATSGFLMMPTMAGAPSGTVGAAGQAATVIDTTNKKICYSTGAGSWECSAAFTP